MCFFVCLFVCFLVHVVTAALESQWDTFGCLWVAQRALSEHFGLHVAPFLRSLGTVGLSCGLLFSTLGAQVENYQKKKQKRAETVGHLEGLFVTFSYKSRVCVGVCLHVVFVSSLFSGFQGCLSLDPLAPAQSKRVFSF